MTVPLPNKTEDSVKYTIKRIFRMNKTKKEFEFVIFNDEWSILKKIRKCGLFILVTCTCVYF